MKERGEGRAGWMGELGEGESRKHGLMDQGVGAGLDGWIIG